MSNRRAQLWWRISDTLSYPAMRLSTWRADRRCAADHTTLPLNGQQWCLRCHRYCTGPVTLSGLRKINRC